jgi:short-subunit dehydrogenase
MVRGLALVTGASSGIGFGLAKLFARDGYDLVVAADEDGIGACADKLGGAGVDVRAVNADLRKPEDVDRLYLTATTDGRTHSAAALNAGSGRVGPFIDGPLDEDLGIVDLNVRSTVQLAKLVLVDVARQGSGRVLFTSSIVAGMPAWNRSTYIASKSFVQSFAEALHDEMRATGMTVTTLMPGPTATNFFRRAGMSDTLLARMRKDDPACVARQGYAALMSGDRKVLAASLFSKVIGMTNWVLPDSVKSAANRLIVTRTGC